MKLSGLGNGAFLMVLILLLAGMALFLLHGQKESGKRLKSRCTGKTSGTLEYVDRGCYFNGFKLSKHGWGNYMYGPSFVITSHAVYTYSVDGTRYLGIDARNPLTLSGGRNRGEEAEIYYNPYDVTEFYCPNEDRNIIYADLIMAGFAAAVIGIIYYFMYVRK